MKTLILEASQIRQIIRIDRAVQEVEEAFRLEGLGKTVMPPKVYLDLPDFNGDFRAMPACLAGGAALKWVSVYPENPQKNLPTVIGTIILSDPRSGFPLCVMDGTLITVVRTAAAAAVASKYLARKDSRTLGLVGCGALADAHIKAISSVTDISQVAVYCPSKEKIERLAGQNPDLAVHAASLEAVAQTDILTTLTPSTTPVVPAEIVGKGTHINAVGADAAGKQELDPSILGNAKVIVDDERQATHSGEINVPLRAGQFSADQIHAKLGQVVAGIEEGREGDELTLFDSTGLAIQDVAVARHVFEEAKTAGLGTEINLVPE
ncbi:MAG: ornithine cyclodeaminase family protein [Terriglobia bacterium]